MLIIGDVHGRIDAYFKILQEYRGDTVQIGDFGFKMHHDWLLNNKFIDTTKSKVLFGNHDYYPYLHERHSLGDFGMHQDMFYIRGAKSIDRYKLDEGIDWFENEELTYPQFWDVIEMYDTERPRIVVSHDCPKSVAGSLFGYYDTGHAADRSITSDALDAVLEVHKPEIWIFGHHHQSRDVSIMGTRFICLDELETLDLKLLI